MSTSEQTPFSTIQERLQRLREGTQLYISEDKPLAPLEINSEDSDNNSSRSHSKEEEDQSEEESAAEDQASPMAETIRQLSNGTEGEVVPLCITYPEPAEGKEADFELKSGFLILASFTKVSWT